MRLYRDAVPEDAWPDTPEARRVHALWAPMLAKGTHWVASNVEAAAALVIGEGHVMPVTASGTGEGSYVTSAVGQYVHYARFEAGRLPSPAARAATLGLVRALSRVLRHLDPVVVLDNAPLSTNLRSPRPLAVWAAATQAVTEAWPGRAVAVRSVDDIRGGALRAGLERLGYVPVLARRVWFQDPTDPWLWRRRDLRRDQRLVREAPLPVRPLEAPDAPTVADLYWRLYGGRYSPLNPRFTPAWLAAGLGAGALRGEGIELDGRLVAVYASIEADGVVTQPVFGYDTALPPSLGLYRRLSLRVLEAARERGLLVHASAGAAGFKAARGALASNEYVMVHLGASPPAQRRAWRLLAALGRRFGAALLDRAA